MRKRFLTNRNLFLGSLLLTGLLVGCSSDDNSGDVEIPGTESHTYKYTVTVDQPIDESDFISFVIVGGNQNPNNNTIWKVNGEVQTGQASVSFNDQSFETTNTYVVETIDPIRLSTSGASFINFGNDLKFRYKIEVDGKEVVSEDQTLSGDSKSWNKDYTF